MVALKDEWLGVPPLSIVDGVGHHPIEVDGTVAMVVVQQQGSPFIVVQEDITGLLQVREALRGGCLPEADRGPHIPKCQ